MSMSIWEWATTSCAEAEYRIGIYELGSGRTGFELNIVG